MLAFGDPEAVALPSTPSSSLRDAIRRLSDDRFGEDPSVEVVASTGMQLLEALCRRLATLVGDSGIGAVLDRAVKDAGRELGWAAAPGVLARRWDTQLEPIRDHLSRLDPVAARTAFVTLLDTFLTMVCTFIGETLTLRLLQELT